MLWCDDQTIYTGITTDVERRFDEHMRSKKGAKYTRSKKPIRVVYVEQCKSRGDALAREAAIKKLPRTAKLALIRTDLTRYHN